MGVVYRALDLQTQRPVAIKRPARAASEQHLRRFRREGEALARLKHPGVVPVLNLGEERGEPFIVLELVGGHSLEEVLRGRGQLPDDEVLELGRCLAEALAYAHEREVLHRDVKPDNVLLPRADQPVLVDFGLAKFEEASGGRLTATGAFAGTLGFAAPEQLADAGKVDARADVYGLGATLYALLTGGPPGGSGPALELVAVTAAGSFPPPRALRPEISRGLSALVMRALARDPSDRFPSMAELADALAALERQGRGRDSSKRRGMTKSLAAGVLALSFLGGVWITAALVSEPPEASPAPVQVSVTPTASPSALTPASSPSPGQLSGAAAAEAGESLSRSLRELQAADTAVAGLRHEAFSAALAQAERIAEPTPRQSWVLGRSYRELARWEDALEAYQDARQPGYELRAELGRGLVLLSRLDGEEIDRQAWVRRGRECLAGAARKGLDQPQGLERAAAHLAELALRLWDLPRGIEVSGTGDRVRSIQAQVPQRELLLRQEIHFAISLGLRKSGAFSIAGTRLEVLEPAPAPVWSPGYAIPLARRFEKLGLTRDSLRPAELLVTLTRGRGGVARSLAEVQAKAGLVGGLERSLGALEGGFSSAEITRLQATIAGKLRKVGRVLGHARAAGAYAFRLEPQETDLLLWVHVPPGTGALEIELQGAQADLDLYADQDGPPSSGAPWRSDDLTHSEHLRIDLASKPPLRPGIVQVRLNRYRAWPEPVSGVVVVRHQGVDAPPRQRWVNAWECSLNGAPKDLRPALAKSHELFLAGRGREIEELLRPHQRRVPRLAFLRAKFLLGLHDLEGVRALATELEGLGQPLPLPLRYGLVPVVASEAGLEQAVKAADQVLKDYPDLLELATMAVRFQARAGDLSGALKRVEALAARDPLDLRIKSLHLKLRIVAGDEGALQPAERLLRESPVALLFEDQIELLMSFSRKRPERADSLFDAIQAREALPTPTQIVEWSRYLLSRRQVAKARRLLSRVEGIPLSPANTSELQGLRRLLR